MEDVIWFLVNYPVFLLLVMNICAYWKRDRVTEALAKVIDSRKRIKIDVDDYDTKNETIKNVHVEMMEQIVLYDDRGTQNPINFLKKV